MKIIAALPLTYKEEGRYETRDLGLVAEGLIQIGVQTSLILLENDQGKNPEKNWIIPKQMCQWEDPGFWAELDADAIIFNGWSATRFQAVREAMMAACPLVIEKLDTDGVKSPHVWFGQSLRQAVVGWHRKAGFPGNFIRRIWALGYGVFRITTLWLFPSLLFRKMAVNMAKVPVHVAETPLACARVNRFIRMFHKDSQSQIVQIPHPANDEVLNFDPSIEKEKMIVAVGRWSHAGKDGRLLLKSVDRFFDLHPDWSLTVVGTGTGFLGKAHRQMKHGSRVTFTGALDHENLSQLYNRSRILFLTSHSETFHIASAEALCCGCSIVGPARLASINWFVSRSSGTLSFRRTASDFCDALDTEAGEWGKGERDAAEIAAFWKARLGMRAVATSYLNLIKEQLGK